jgi:hypothetical protein
LLDFGPVGLRCRAEEDEGNVAELLAASAGRGEAWSGGDGERPKLGFARACREGEGGKMGRRNGVSPLAAVTFVGGQGMAEGIRAVGAIDGRAGSRQLPTCVCGEEDKGRFCKEPHGFWDSFGILKIGFKRIVSLYFATFWS